MITIFSDQTTKTSSSRPKPKDLIGNITSYSHIRAIEAGGELYVITVINSTGASSRRDYKRAYTLLGPRNNDLVAQAQQRAYLRAMSKLKQQNINIGVFLAELPETLAFLVNGARSLLSCWRMVKNPRKWRNLWRLAKRNGFKGSFRSGIRDAASLWMMWRYAVMPIVYDTQGILEEMKFKEPPLSRVKATVHLTDRTRRALGPQDLFADIHEDVRCSYVYYVEPRPSLDLQREFMRLGLTNLPEILWEVTPLSFVVDWFIPIGDRLAVLDVPFFFTIKGAYRSTRRKIKSRVESVSTTTVTDLLTRTATYTEAEAQLLDSYVRERLTNFSPPAVTWHSNLNLKRYLDALSLIRLLFFKR